jgi:hypothetical protein
VNVDPELRKRVEQIKSSPVELYREAGDYSNRELVEGILVSPDDIAAIEAVARAGVTAERLRDALREVLHGTRCQPDNAELDAIVSRTFALAGEDDVDPAEAAHHRMVQPDRYQRWER